MQTILQDDKGYLWVGGRKGVSKVNIKDNTAVVMQTFTSADGLPGRPWYRNLYAASDEDSGYAAWMLPGLRHAVEHGDTATFRMMETLYQGTLENLLEMLERLASG